VINQSDVAERSRKMLLNLTRAVLEVGIKSWNVQEKAVWNEDGR